MRHHSAKQSRGRRTILPPYVALSIETDSQESLERRIAQIQLELDDPKNLRRTVYARISRLKLNDVLIQFDYPDANVHAENRSQYADPGQRAF